MNVSFTNLLNRTSVRQNHAAATRRTTAHTASFHNVLQSSSAATSAGAATSSAAKAGASAAVSTPVSAPSPTVSPASTVATTNAFPVVTGGPAPAPISDPAPMPVASYTPLPAKQIALLNQPWDPFNKSQHEASMNNWYMNYTQHANQQKLQIYQQGVADWKVNAARCRDLGMQAPPPPTPPVLEAVGPLPDGYWFGTKV